MSRPKLPQALVDVGAGTVTTTIRMQYLRGLGGFGPTSEGMAAWIIGMVAIIAAALWIGARA